MSSETEPRPLRERKREATREKLVDRALELFGTRGYQATTMDDIAAAADVSRATAFNYFPRKEEFLLEWVERRRAGVVALLAREQKEDVDTMTRLEHAFMTLGERLEADPDINRALIRAFIEAGVLLQPGGQATAAVFAETIRHGQARGDLRTDLDADSVGQLLLGAYIGVLLRWATADESSPSPRRDVSMKAQLGTLLAMLSPALDPAHARPKRRSRAVTRPRVLTSKSRA